MHSRDGHNDMCGKLNTFKKGVFFKIFDISKKCKNGIQDKSKKIEVDLALENPTKSIFRLLFFTDPPANAGVNQVIPISFSRN